MKNKPNFAQMPAMNLRGASLIELILHVRDAVRKKTGLCGKNSQVADPPPQFGKPLLSKKKVGFIFHFRTSGTFLVFTKKSPFWVID